MSIKSKEFILWSFYNSVRDGLGDKLYNMASNVGCSVGELMGASFSYIVGRILAGTVKMPENASEFYEMLFYKAKSFIKDEFRAQSRAHGRRSIRTRSYLDVIDEDGNRTLDASASMSAYYNKVWKEEHAYCCSLTPKVFEIVLDDMRIKGRNRKILRECMLLDASREVVAKRYGTTRGNVDVLVCRCRRGLAKYGLEHFQSLYQAAA